MFRIEGMWWVSQYSKMRTDCSQINWRELLTHHLHSPVDQTSQFGFQLDSWVPMPCCHTILSQVIKSSSPAHSNTDMILWSTHTLARNMVFVADKHTNCWQILYFSLYCTELDAKQTFLFIYIRKCLCQSQTTPHFKLLPIFIFLTVKQTDKPYAPDQITVPSRALKATEDNFQKGASTGYLSNSSFLS